MFHSRANAAVNNPVCLDYSVRAPKCSSVGAVRHAERFSTTKTADESRTKAKNVSDTRQIGFFALCVNTKTGLELWLYRTNQMDIPN